MLSLSCIQSLQSRDFVFLMGFGRPRRTADREPGGLDAMWRQRHAVRRGFVLWFVFLPAPPLIWFASSNPEPGVQRHEGDYGTDLLLDEAPLGEVDEPEAPLGFKGRNPGLTGFEGPVQGRASRVFLDWLSRRVLLGPGLRSASSVFLDRSKSVQMFTSCSVM